jgi:hypothetical protein
LCCGVGVLNVTITVKNDDPIDILLDEMSKLIFMGWGQAARI